MDTVTTSRSLEIDAGFADGDTRRISVDSPNTAINLVAAVKNFRKFVAENDALIGDRAGAPFERFISAKILSKTVTKFDV